jgi:superfamily I DNA/RNA helicase
MTKYAYLMAKGVLPEKIMCVTFTNKAAKEMRDRACSLIGMVSKQLENAWINTFHSLSFKLLTDEKNYEMVGLKEKFHVVDKSEQERILRELLKED